MCGCLCGVVLDGEEALLSLWMMRGGGESGDKAVALWFLQEDGASRSLDAEQLGAVVREQLGFTMDPACSELLTRLVGDGGDSDPRVLSKEGLKVWMRGRFPAYHVRQMLKSVDFLTPIVTQLLGSAPQRDGLEHWRLLAKEDVRQVLGASMNEWVDAIHSKISAFQHAVGKQDVAAPNLMFAGDLGSCGNTFEGKYESADAFDAGLDKFVGKPDRVLDAIINEHCNSNSTTPGCTTSNYGLTCTPKEEVREKEKKGKNVRMDTFFAAVEAVRGWKQEVLAVHLYTGPMFMHYNAVLRKFPASVLATMKGNNYVTTVHCINSAIMKRKNNLLKSLTFQLCLTPFGRWIHFIFFYCRRSPSRSPLRAPSPPSSASDISESGTRVRGSGTGEVVLKRTRSSSEGRGNCATCSRASSLPSFRNTAKLWSELVVGSARWSACKVSSKCSFRCSAIDITDVLSNLCSSCISCLTRRRGSVAMAHPGTHPACSLPCRSSVSRYSTFYI